jgi:anti-sigma-K factor RskA
MTAHEIHALSGAYAVDALDDAERALFEEHLAACPTCQEEVTSLVEATAHLADSTATPAPASLRDSVLAEISKVRPLPPLTDGTITLVRRRPRWVNALAAAAAAAAFFGGGAIVWQQTHPTTQQIGAADQVILARDATKVSVDLPGGASATVYRSASLNRAALVTRGLAKAPNAHVYELWLRKDGIMVPAGFLTGSGNRTVLLDGAANGATGAGITVEPAGGSAAPTTLPIALFDFQRAT